MDILYNEDHVKPREDGGHEFNVFLALGVVPSTKHGVCSRQHRTTGVQGCCYSSLVEREISGYGVDSGVDNGVDNGRVGRDKLGFNEINNNNNYYTLNYILR